MKITRVTATALRIPVDFSELGVDRIETTSMCYTEVETDTGIVGHGITSITQCGVVAHAINTTAGPSVVGADPNAQGM